jgi:hypothetical protein
MQIIVFLQPYLLVSGIRTVFVATHYNPCLCPMTVFLFQCSNTENKMDIKASCYVGTHENKYEYKFIYLNTTTQKNRIDIKKIQYTEYPRKKITELQISVTNIDIVNEKHLDMEHG